MEKNFENNTIIFDFCILQVLDEEEDSELATAYALFGTALLVTSFSDIL